MDAKTVVEAGCAVLDEQRPGWRLQVDCGRLNMGDVWNCVAAQVATPQELDLAVQPGGRSPYAQVVATLSGIPLPACSAEAVSWTYQHGFDAWPDEGISAWELQKEWLRVIQLVAVD